MTYDRKLLFSAQTRIKEKYLIGKIVTNNFEVQDNKSELIMVSEKNEYIPGYKAYIFGDHILNDDTISYCFGVKNINDFLDGDVIRISNDGLIRILYRCDSDDNVIFVTNQCNSNCIMCPDSEIVRKNGENVPIEELIEYINYIPKDCKHLTITGGEPGLLKEDLIVLLKECKNKLPNTNYLLLSNGRVFSDEKYLKRIIEYLPNNIRFGIPLYSSEEKIHDNITNVKSSFKQTVYAIKKMLEYNISVEIRTVILKKNYDNLIELSNFIIKEFKKVDFVNFMSLEMLGNCLKNKNDVWIEFEKIDKYLLPACLNLVKNRVNVQLYNFPLCLINNKLISLAKNSITDYKVKYKKDCDSCRAKEICGGFFFSTVNMKEIIVKPL